jgi:murein DD-endopeptidase MepM/ murein hydrolase activator NlpD
MIKFCILGLTLVSLGCIARGPVTMERMSLNSVPWIEEVQGFKKYHPPLNKINLRTMYGGFDHPMNKPKSTFGYGVRSNGKRDHTGIDLLAPIGTPIYSMYEGIIKEIRRTDPYSPKTKKGAHGKRVRIRSKKVLHGHDVDFLYAHLSNIPSDLQEGNFVRSGDLLGYTGISGNARYIKGISKNTQEQHLHLECRVDQDLISLLGFGQAMSKDFSDEKVHYINPYLLLL